MSGRLSSTGHLENLTDLSRDQAAINAVPIAKAILRDEAARLAQPRFQVPSFASKPPSTSPTSP
jgi:hypothetical protein